MKSHRNKATDHALLRVRQAEAGMRLDRFLAARLSLSRHRAKDLLDQRLVFVNQRRTWIAHHPLEPGDVVEVAPPFARPPSPWSDILFQDRHVVIVNKNAGYLSEGEDSVEQALRRRLGSRTLRVAHRLDQDTSGCLLLAGTETIRRRCVALFRARRVTKEYLAIVHGSFRRPRTIRAALDGHPAVSQVEPVFIGQIASLVRVVTLTGRKHQVRRHLAFIGFPVAGDRMYATGAIVEDRLRRLPRQMLHALTLRLPHPVTGIPITATAAPPPEFRAAIRYLGLRLPPAAAVAKEIPRRNP